MVGTLQKHRSQKRPLSDGTRAIINRLAAHKHELRNRGVTSLALFGSRARGDERRNSDLDVLIDYDQTRRFTLYDLVDIQRYLSDIVELEAHVVTRDGFGSDRLQRLLKHAIDVF